MNTAKVRLTNDSADSKEADKENEEHAPPQPQPNSPKASSTPAPDKVNWGAAGWGGGQCPKITFWFGCRRGKFLRKKGARVENCHLRTYITQSGKDHFEKKHQCLCYRDETKHYQYLLHDILFFKSISVSVFKT